MPAIIVLGQTFEAIQCPHCPMRALFTSTEQLNKHLFRHGHIPNDDPLQTTNKKPPGVVSRRWAKQRTGRMGALVERKVNISMGLGGRRRSWGRHGSV